MTNLTGSAATPGPDHLAEPVSLEAIFIPRSPAEAAKAIVYIVLAALAILQLGPTGGEFGWDDTLQITVAVAGAIPVYLLAATWAKSAAAFVVSAAQALIVIIGNQGDLALIDYTQWIAVAITALSAIGIVFIPNRETPAAIEVAEAELSAEVASLR